MSPLQKALAWLRDAPPGEKRTQSQAAALFGTRQSSISRARGRILDISRPIAADGKARRAVAWMLSAPIGETRTQSQAAKRFGITQPTVSLALKRMAGKLDWIPDGRYKR